MQSISFPFHMYMEFLLIIWFIKSLLESLYKNIYILFWFRIDVRTKLDIIAFRSATL